LADHVNRDVSKPLVAIQLDTTNAFFSILRQTQLDNLSGKASRTYDGGRVQAGDELPKPHALDKCWGYFESMQGNASIMRFSNNQVHTHHLPCSKGGQQGDSLEIILCAVTVHPSIGRVCERHRGCKAVGICDDIFIVGFLSDALSCAAEIKQILKVDLHMVLNDSKFNPYFPDHFLNFEEARTAFECAVTADLLLGDIADIEAGVPADGASCRGSCWH